MNISKINNRLGVFILLISDILILIGLFYLSALIRKFIAPLIFHNIPVFTLKIDLYFWIFPVWLFILIYEGAYSKRLTFWDEVRLLWKCTFFASLTILTVLFIGKQSAIFSRAFILTMSLSSFIIFPVIRVWIKRLIYSLGLMKRKILIVGAGESGRLAFSAIKNEPYLGYDVVGFIDDEPLTDNKIEGIKIHRYIDRVERYIEKCGIHDILIAKPELEKQRLVRIINTIQHKVENTLYIPDLTGIAVLGTELRHFFKEQAIVIEIKNNLAQPANYFIKRIFDYLVGFLLFLLLTVPLLLISLIIRMTSKGPAIFKQDRIGKNGKSFMCYKFRTMYVDAEERLRDILAKNPESKAEWEKYWKLKNDPRVTGFGKFLRETSLDELPQIFNLLKGEMSLVGPRPVTIQEIEMYYKEAAELCFSVPPGITGLWQVSGRSDKSYDERISLDSWYVRNWNLWLDVIILLKTVNVVLRKEGAR